MKKHKFNIFPEAKPEDFNRLKSDIEANGFDSQFPVVLFEGDILDGWNRQKACDELKVTPIYEEFRGSESEAVEFVLRSNKRRNLNSGQWACIATEAEGLLKAISEQVEKNRRQRQAETQSITKTTRPKSDEAMVQKIEPQPKKDNAKLTASKIAEPFNTNRTYVSQAAKIKDVAPEVFEKVKAGKMTMQDATRAVKAIPTDPWSESERERQKLVEAGSSVVANASRDKNLIQWAESKSLAVRVDRSTEFGNPFILDLDGDRDEVCDSYCDHYLPHKPSIKAKLSNLKGKVLICHCYPERCHADSLAEKANHHGR